MSKGAGVSRKRFEALCAKARKSHHRADLDSVRESYKNDEATQAKVRSWILDDLHRVHKHPENKSIVSPVSRDFYRQLGAVPEVVVEDFFGNHSEFLRAADLKDKRGTQKSQARSAKLHTEQDIHRFAQENVTRFHGKWDKRGKRKHVEGLVCSDVHSMHCDPFARFAFMRAVEIVSPDVVVVNGDLVDFPSISSHSKPPGHFHMSLQDELDWARDFLGDVRRRAPEATIYFVIGNHEYRLVRYLADTAPALASLRALSFDQIFGLDEFEVSLVCRSNFLAASDAARRKDLAENWVVIGGCYVATHGTSCAKFAAANELGHFAMSGTSGHTHRPQIFHGNTLGTGPISWMSTPMMCHHSDGRDFVHGPTPWTMGFGQFSIIPEKRAVSQSVVQVHEDACVFAGVHMSPTAQVLAERRAMMEVA